MTSRATKIAVMVFIFAAVGGITAFALLGNRTEKASPDRQTPQAKNNSATRQSDTNAEQGAEMSEANQDMNITINVGSESYEATLANNETGRAFLGRLPLTLVMNDVNSNEKAFDLPEPLPSNHANPGRIQNGDLMLYGSRTLVLFYETFPTSYTYTRIGQVNDPAHLADVLGSGDVEVTFQP